MNGPFCDWLSVSTSRDWAYERRPALAALLGDAGAYEEQPGLWRLPCPSTSWGKGGTVLESTRGPAAILAATGKALAQLRLMGLFQGYLGVLGEFPHRVTRLDATLERSEVDAPALLADLVEGYHAGRYRVSRKRLPGAKQRVMLSPCPVTDQPTGTFYAGNRRTDDVVLKGYDKRAELILRHGAPLELAPSWRDEFTFGRQVGCTLRDAWDPSALFWSHAVHSHLAHLAPDPVPEWSPMQDPWRPEPYEPKTPYARMVALVEGSPDVLRLLALAQEAGPGGMDALHALLDRLEARRHAKAS